MQVVTGYVYSRDLAIAPPSAILFPWERLLANRHYQDIINTWIASH